MAANVNGDGEGTWHRIDTKLQRGVRVVPN